jgi:hypothetical protein
VSYGGFGGALFLIAAGAILRYAVTWDPEEVDLGAVGVILMVCGGLLLLATFFLAFVSPRGPGGPPRSPGR